jgi:hypothetical protein
MGFDYAAGENSSQAASGDEDAGAFAVLGVHGVIL